VRSARVTVVLGAPIPLPRVADPDDATVRRWLDTFVDAMAALYEAHKDGAGCGAVPLEIR
jgi:hypothetical protein